MTKQYSDQFVALRKRRFTIAIAISGALGALLPAGLQWIGTIRDRDHHLGGFSAFGMVVGAEAGCLEAVITQSFRTNRLARRLNAGPERAIRRASLQPEIDKNLWEFQQLWIDVRQARNRDRASFLAQQLAALNTLLAVAEPPSGLEDRFWKAFQLDSVVALQAHGDTRCVEGLRALSRGERNADAEVAAAASRSIYVIEAREAAAHSAGTLLRPASAEGDANLLRAATASPVESGEELVRPAEIQITNG